ncbi:MAG: metallophosphoesterase [bacterium]
MTPKQPRRLPGAFFILLFSLGAFSYSQIAYGPAKVVNPRPVPAFDIPASAPGTNYTYFIALGDQGEGDANQRRVAELMNQKAARDSLHFVLFLGDSFYPSGVTSVDDPQWQRKFEDMYDLPFLQLPFYATLGNHDHLKGMARFQVEYSKRNPRWIMPSPHYTFIRTIAPEYTIQFFALDTEPFFDKKKFDPSQIAWLERELQNCRATWKVVVGHHPVFSFGEHGHKKPMIELVRPLLEKYGVDLYLAGHDHDRQMLQPVGGVHYIVSGTGAKSRDTAYGPISMFAATNLGFAWFRVSAEEFHVQFLNGEGKVEYAHTWRRGAVKQEAYTPALVMDNSIRFDQGRKNSKGRKHGWWQFWRE